MGVQEPKKIAVAWGVVVVVQRDGTLLCLKEKPLAAKLELLYNKSLYLVALNLAHSEQVPHSCARPAWKGSSHHLRRV